MALRYSTALRNAVASGYGWREALRDGRLFVYSGTQPATADEDASGTLLVTFTLEGGSYTAPIRSKASLTLSGTSGSLDSVTVGGTGYNLLSAPVSFDTDLATTAQAVADNINARQNLLNITASASTEVVTLSAPFWLGAWADGLSVATTETTLGVAVNGGTSTTFGGSGAPSPGTTAVNGCNFKYPAATGTLSKEDSVWQGVASAGGTAGWFRFVPGGSDVAGVSTADLRFDGSIATSNADLNIASTSISSGATQTINTFDFTVPAS